ncbi:hypothetical protein [Streptomyces sp. AD55]|uniref:hypothetical protein n=1 Tax=Streptomyces sp. AD55 TaxID=3242895 RepID=UPI00352948E1
MNTTATPDAAAAVSVRPTAFCVSLLPETHHEFRLFALALEREHGTNLWTVRWNGQVLHADGTWGYESCRCRRVHPPSAFPLFEAVALAEAAAPATSFNGRTAAQVYQDTGKDTCPDISTRLVRTTPAGESDPDRGPLPTRAEAARTRPDSHASGRGRATRRAAPNPAPDTVRPDTARTEPGAPDDGVRIEFRARVPRHLAPAALAEGFQAIADQTSTSSPAADRTPRQQQAAHAIADAFDIPTIRETP